MSVSQREKPTALPWVRQAQRGATGFALCLVCLVRVPVTRADEVHADIEYRRVGNDRLLLDASVPDGPGPFPVVLVVHGGGWMSGDKKTGMGPILQPLTDAHFVWFSINYRMAPASRWPACLDDVNAAIRWVKAHAAEYKGDPRRIALLGYSAGGHLACLAATTATADTAVQAVVGLAPPTDLELDLPQRGGLSLPLQNLLDRPHEVDDASLKTLREISAIHFVHAGLPPFLIMQGTGDKSVPYSGSVAFVAKLREAGVPCAFVSLPNAPHRIADWMKYDDHWGTKLTEWLNATLRPQSATNRPATQP
jgi:acetyl esterase/lipase